MYLLVENHYNTNRKHLINVMSKQLGDEAEDAVQEAYFRALKYIHAYNPEEFEFQRWFSRILSNVRKDFIAERFGRVTGSPIQEDDLVSPEDPYASQVLQVVYDEILLVNDPNHREILTLALIFGYNLRDVVKIVDMKMGTVNQIITRFKSKMKKTYA